MEDLQWIAAPSTDIRDCIQQGMVSRSRAAPAITTNGNTTIVINQSKHPEKRPISGAVKPRTSTTARSERRTAAARSGGADESGVRSKTMPTPAASPSRPCPAPAARQASLGQGDTQQRRRGHISRRRNATISGARTSHRTGWRRAPGTRTTPGCSAMRPSSTPSCPVNIHISRP